MTRSTQLCKKRKFRGNQHKKPKEDILGLGLGQSGSDHSEQTQVPPEPDVTPVVSASKRKLGDTTAEFVNYSAGNNNVIISLDILCQALNCVSVCKHCKLADSLSVTEDEDARQGLACKLLIQCKNCDNQSSLWTSPKSDQFYDVNLKCVYGLRSIGKGSVASKSLFGMLDLPNPPVRFERYNPLMVKALKSVASQSMIKATEEAVEKNVADDGSVSRDISVGIDGTWQKRGFSSLNGVVSVSSFDTSKILDVEILTKYCHFCSTSKNKRKPHFCQKNFAGSSGAMEVEGAKRVFSRSEATRNVKYKYYLGDGDSKGFASVVESKPYGPNFTIEKLECVGHVQKRMGGRLRNLRKSMKGEKLWDGKKIGGKKGRLTDSAIDTLQNYYGLAIRRNKDNLDQMKKDVKATLSHKSSTDAEPKHDDCDESWCKYKQSLKENKPYTHKNSLDPAIVEAIQPIFDDLSKPELLQKCLHGRTQNINESFNNVVWSRVSKKNFVGQQTLKYGTYDAVVSFNEGNRGRIQVLEAIRVKVSQNCVRTLQEIDKERVAKSEFACKEESKLARKRSRMVRKNLLDAENKDEPDYAYGMF